MKVSVEAKDTMIISRFHGETRIEDLIESWNRLLDDFENLQEYKGIVTSFLDAELMHKDKNMNIIVEYLKGRLDKLRDLKLAFVLDSPMVTNTIILGQKMNHLQIKPFSTEEAAVEWVDL